MASDAGIFLTPAICSLAGRTRIRCACLPHRTGQVLATTWRDHDVMRRRWGTPLDILPSDADARALLLDAVPRASAYWAAARRVAAASGGTKAQRAAAADAVPAPLEPTGLEVQAVVADLIGGENVGPEARDAIALAGCTYVVLALPHAAQGCGLQVRGKRVWCPATRGVRAQYGRPLGDACAMVVCAVA
jgi:hypothetical protein